MAGTAITLSLFETNCKGKRFPKLVVSSCNRYDGNAEHLSSRLEDAHICFSNEGVTEPYQILAIRILLVGDARNYYLTHEDLVHNFGDLRKLLLHNMYFYGKTNS
jgi:hypothetical protein